MSPGARSTNDAPGGDAATASRKPGTPYIALFFSSVAGLGYIPVAPGTFGALAGVLIALIPFQILAWMGKVGVQSVVYRGFPIDPLLVGQIIGALAIALIGVWVSSITARHFQTKDPQKVVIDEVSGQHLTLVLGSILPVWGSHAPQSWAPRALGFITYESVLSWKYLLLGLILFRVFDIWKPFPVRQAESLRGGWGIMADDWIAGIYAALLLWAARRFVL